MEFNQKAIRIRQRTSLTATLYAVKSTKRRDPFLMANLATMSMANWATRSPRLPPNLEQTTAIVLLVGTKAPKQALLEGNSLLGMKNGCKGKRKRSREAKRTKK
jgi:hypothetical protein